MSDNKDPLEDDEVSFPFLEFDTSCKYCNKPRYIFGSRELLDYEYSFCSVKCLITYREKEFITLLPKYNLTKEQLFQLHKEMFYLHLDISDDYKQEDE